MVYYKKHSNRTKRHVVILISIFTIFCVFQFTLNAKPLVSTHGLLGNVVSTNYQYHKDTSITHFWYDSKAEIATYDISQPRYGENRKGYAVMVTVTEDFSNTKHVKLDNTVANPNQATKVLKNIFIRRFITGIYDYSLMTSTFVPFIPHYKDEKEIYPLKITLSSQDWCGQSYIQLNNKDSRYALEIRSYFEIEGDHVDNIAQSHSADGLWAIARINPKELPVGEFKLLPFLSELNLHHWKAKRLVVNGRLDEGVKYYTYVVESSNKQFRYSMSINRKKPYIIDSFYIEADGKRTSFVLNHISRLPYWKLNHIKDEGLREEYNLPWTNNN